MPRFEFRLESVLSVRRSDRDLRRTELAEVMATHRAVQDRLAGLAQELIRRRRELRASVAPGPIDVDRLLSVNRYEVSLRRERHALAERAQTLAVEIERRRQILAAAEADVRALEKLRERQLEQFRSEQARAEAKELDEVACRLARHFEAS